MNDSITPTPYNFAMLVAWKTLMLLINRKVLLYPTGMAFCVWRRGDRMIVAFDPAAIQLERINDDFVHALSTQLEGRLVLRTNSRGMFLQVGFEIPPAPTALIARSLDIGQQATPWHMPIGITAQGELWISLIEGDSFLLGGTRGGGKSGLVNGMIQALLVGERTEVYACDGKRGAELGRYIGHPKFHFMGNVEEGMKALSEILARRLDQLRNSGYPNIMMHNAAGGEFITPIALVVDEIADLDDGLKESIKGMVKLYRACGLYPILATNDPVQSAILVKSNLATRVCFRVPSFNDSITVLGNKGAEKLPSQVGRGLVLWNGRLTEFQSFTVDFPRLSASALQELAAQVDGKHPASSESAEPAPDPDVAKISELIEQGETDAAIVRKVWGVSGGSRSYKLKERVKALRSKNTSSSTSSSQEPILGLEGVG